MNNVLNRNTLSDLADALKEAQRNRVLFGVLLFLMLGFQLVFLHRRSDIASCVLAAGLCFWYLGTSNDPPFDISKLKRSVESFDGPPSADAIAILTQAARYTVVAWHAWGRLIELLPLLDESEVKRVDSDTWMKLYALSADMPYCERALMYDKAVLLADARAIPFIENTLLSQNLTEDLRTELKAKIATLKDSTIRGKERNII